MPPDLLVREWATLNQIDGRTAAAETLAAYLRRSIFWARAGKGEQPKPFQLTQVLEEWPDADTQMQYPSVSMTDAQDTEILEHSLVPTPVESSYGLHGEGTALWKVCEIGQLFQVDFWCNNKTHREAIAAGLAGMFSPGEGQSGVVLEGSPDFFCARVRCSLENYRRQDADRSSFNGEWRLITRIRCEVDVLELRCSTILRPEIVIQAVGTGDLSQE